MHMETPKVYSVVLNWNGRDDTIKCVNSILSSTLQTQVILVDNASTDDSVAAFQAQAHWKNRVEIVKSTTNSGTAAGNNIGIKRALERNADYVFINNNDAFVHRDAINELVDTAILDPKIAIVSPLIMYYGTDKVWCAGAALNTLIFKARLLGMGMNESQFSGIRRIDYAVGAVMLVNAEAIKKAGLFDEKLFYYYEETVWQYKMRQAGYHFVLNCQAKVGHKVGSSSGGGRTPLSSYYLIRNRGWFIRDCAPIYVKPIAYASLVCEAFARLAISLPRGPKVGTMAIRGLWDFMLGKTGRFSG